MEESCPATPLVLTGRDSKSPLQVPTSSPESDGMKSPSRDSPDSRCVICLGKLRNKSFTDSCLHQFCFQCLLQWSKIKAECPLCKQPFKSIIHNVRSNLDYDQYHVEHGEPRYVLSDLVHSYNFDLIPVDRRFRYRSTMTREYFRELAEFLAQTRRFPEDTYQISPMVPVDPEASQHLWRSTRSHGSSGQRLRHQGTSDFRRNIYAQDLWVQDLVDISGRYRECTPQFYRENPAQIHRIIPWLNREVNVLLSDCESHAAYVLSRIISILTQHSIRSREFRELVQPYFGDRTDHFVHELYTFARSVYDIAGFDQNAVYGTNPNYATEVQEISSSNEDDSDIEVIETVKNGENKLKKSSRQGLKKILLRRAGKGEAKVDEPIAGPSGLNSAASTDPIEICESDPEEIKVLDYVKPEPEVVTLSSGEDSLFTSRLNLSPEEYEGLSYKGKRKLSKDRNSSTDESFSCSEKRKKHKNGKGKCKSNGFGLKGRQKSKYMKAKRSRSTSSSSSSSDGSRSTITTTTSTSSYSTSSKSSRSRRRSRSISTISSHSSEHKANKHKKKKSKTSSSKYKKKKMYKSSRKVLDLKKQKSSSCSNSESKRTSRQKKKVKSCVIVPGSTFCDSLGPPSKDAFSSRVSANPKYHRPVHHSLESYWSLGSNSRRKWENSSSSRVLKSKRRHKERCGQESSVKRVRDCSSPEHSSKSYFDVDFTSSRKPAAIEHSKSFKFHNDKVGIGNPSSAENENLSPSSGIVDDVTCTPILSSSQTSNYSVPTVTSPNHVNFD